ncbi:bifunctional metallophosphatase/5'-nucleotidase [Rhodoferax sp. GW822-FHT02A01]|uniref:bifunctional metallophosphatase/5'-nucleotidase n=1 Tax=Rhodoferax sp. GW822-FHT02A01 TaxID=3141537 RepID=UPI00315CE4F4
MKKCAPADQSVYSPMAALRAVRISMALAALVTLLCATLVPAARADEPVHVSLIAINDFHGNILPPAGSVLMPDAANASGTRVAAGGAAYLASLVRELRAQNPGRTLVVGAGDLVGATPLASGLFHDEPTIEVLNQIGLDISSVGNHEFDKGRKELLRLQNGGCYPRAEDGSTGIVGKDTCMNAGGFPGARFQYLAANVVDTRTEQTLLPATALREVGGVKIGFIGLTLRATPSVVTPAGVVGLRFVSEVATVNKLAPQLKAQGAAAVVVLIHQGGQTGARTVQDKTCPDFSGPILDLADGFDSAVDVVVSGHTHQEYVCTRPDGKLVTQTGFYGRLLTRIDLQIDAMARKVVAKDANNFVVLNGAVVKDINGNPLPLPQGAKALEPDPQVEAIVRRYGDLTAPLSEMEVGRLTAPLERRTNAAGESTLGALIADAFLAGTSDSSYGDKPAQIAFTNPGGLRSDLTSSLTVTFGQLFNVLPFNNTLVTMDLTGAQILRLLEQQWERPQPAGGRVLPVSQGFSYVWDASKPEGAAPGTGHRVVPGSMRLNGEPMEMDKLYRVTVNSFMASGGDAFNVFKSGRNVQEGDNDLAVTKLYLRVKGLVQPPVMGRIQRLN